MNGGDSACMSGLRIGCSACRGRPEISFVSKLPYGK